MAKKKTSGGDFEILSVVDLPVPKDASKEAGQARRLRILFIQPAVYDRSPRHL